MFAVPGWAVSASTPVQEKPRPKQSSTNHQNTKGEERTKKRKRNLEQLESEDSTANTATTRSPASFSSRSAGFQNASSIPKSDKQYIDHDKPATKHKNHNASGGVQDGTFANAGSNRFPRQGNEQEVTVTRKQNENQKTRGPKVEKQREASTSIAAATPQLSPTVSSTPKLTPLQAKMRSKLTSARFRHLNETLYTTSSADALKLFSTSPELFSDYHAGFAQQVKDSWPRNPVEDYVQAVRNRGSLIEPARGVIPLPRRKTGSCTIADLGCGDAPLARGCQGVVKSLQLKFHSYDLHAVNTQVTQADIADLPLRDGEADIAVFCLSLMGTNWISFVEEAWRVLRGDGKGEVWVAEVKSRFGRVTKGRVVDNSVGKRRKSQKSNSHADDYDGPEQFAEDDRAPEEMDDETDITAFIKVFTRRGFQLREGSVNKRNKMFVSMIFTKSGIPTAGKHKGMKWTGREYQKQSDTKSRFVGGQKDDEEASAEQEAKVLKPCVYKTR